ncbi:hypothetical protein LJC09_04205 [Desulfovibrio sp. OttesenSCG-928-F20]|nr:hypothetical protein [Desulfovibrio sp. OttesenSCG-928-F20]
MTLSSQTTKTVYIPDGVAVRYAVPFPLFSPQDLECWQVDAAGNETAISNFTVEGFGTQSGVYARFAAPPAAGTSLVIRRSTRQVQESAYPEGGKFPSAVVENDLDRIVGMIQELDEAVERSLKVNVSEEKAPESAEELHARVVATLEKAESKAAEAAGSAEVAAGQAGIAAEQAGAAKGQAMVAGNSADLALDMAELARQWAENPEDAPVQDGFSAYHWALKALENAAGGMSLSDALDGGRRAVDGVGASEWALAQAVEAAQRAEAKAATAAASAYAGAFPTTAGQITIAIPVSPTQYTVPANGWVRVSSTLAAGGHLSMTNEAQGYGTVANRSTGDPYGWGHIYMPVNKGETIEIRWGNTYSGAAPNARFLYARGAI